MHLTPAQIATLKADINAKSASGQILQALVAGNDWQGVAGYYNNPTASPTNVWRPDAPRDALFGAIVWKNLTVSDAPPTGATSVTDGLALNFHSRCMQCQGFQMNLQIMLPPGATTLPGDQPSYRQGLQDALSAVPSGAGGTTQSAGWAAVQNVLRRPGTAFEVLFSSVDGGANKSTVYGVRVDGNDCYTAYAS